MGQTDSQQQENPNRTIEKSDPEQEFENQKETGRCGFTTGN